MGRELPMFSPPGDDPAGHPHGGALPETIAMGGGSFSVPAADGSLPLRRHPDWIRARIPSGEPYHELKSLLRGLDLNTVCEEAHCPNIGECWDQRTATIMILGDTCTRACGFCAVKTGRPTWFDDDEPRRVAEAVAALDLEHVVVTSVARDDLPDGGARIFAETIVRMRAACPGMGIEVLIPDFDGTDDRLRTVMDARPDILNHNLETVRRLQKPVRKRARWDRSLHVLARAKDMARRDRLPGPYEVEPDGRPRRDARGADRGVRGAARGRRRHPDDRPVPAPDPGQHLPLERYYHPDEFAEMKAEASALGFKHVESGAAGPLELPRPRPGARCRAQAPAPPGDARRRGTGRAGVAWRAEGPLLE